MGFRAKIRISAISCDSVHLCVVLGSELHQIGFPMMNPVDFMKKVMIFRISGQLAMASVHLQTQKFMQLATASNFTWEASCSRF